MIIHKILKQRSDQWFSEKAGKISSSRVKPIMSGKSLGTGAQTYAVELIAEKLLTIMPDNFVTFAMQQGIDNEPYIRDTYIESRKIEVTEVGGVENNEKTCWFSPDGLIFEKKIIEGFIEIKSPQPKQHMINLLSKEIDSIYVPQIQFGFLITGARYCDFISYNPLFKEGLQFKVIRVLPDFKYITEMEKRINSFLFLMEKIISDSNTNLTLI